MTTNDELPEKIVASLRDIAPASDAVRERHISNALDELRSASTTHRKRNLMAIAAAAVVLAGGAVALRAQNSASPALASHTVDTLTTVPAKGAVVSEGSSIASSCATAPEKVVGSYQLDNSRAILIETTGGVRVAVEASCDTTTYLTFPTTRAASQTPTDCSAPELWEMLLVAHFTDANGYFHWIGVNNQSVEMFDCSSRVTTTAPHPQI